MAARLAAMALMLWGAASGAVAECRQALMLALDVSGAVDQREYRLQLDGLANALLDPQVVAALETLKDHRRKDNTFTEKGWEMMYGKTQSSQGQAAE